MEGEGVHSFIIPENFISIDLMLSSYFIRAVVRIEGGEVLAALDLETRS